MFPIIYDQSARWSVRVAEKDDDVVITITNESKNSCKIDERVGLVVPELR